MKDQLNIKLSAAQVELLEGALFARELDSRMQVVRPALDALFSELKADEGIAAALAERRRRKEVGGKEAGAKVQKIGSARQQRKSGSGVQGESSG